MFNVLLEAEGPPPRERGSQSLRVDIHRTTLEPHMKAQCLDILIIRCSEWSDFFVAQAQRLLSPKTVPHNEKWKGGAECAMFKGMADGKLTYTHGKHLCP